MASRRARRRWRADDRVSTSRLATMPITPGCQPSRPRTIAPAVADAARRADHLVGLGDDRLLDLLAPGVAAVELLGDLAGADGVVGRQHLDGPHRALEPAGGVDPGREAEADHPGRQLPLVQAARRPPSRPAARRVGSAAIPAEPVADEDPVLADERDDVGDRRQRHQADRPDEEVAEVGRGLLAVAEALADLPGELERHPRAAEVGARVGAARRAAGGRSRRPRGARSPIVWWSVTISSRPSSRASSASATAEIPQSTVTTSSAFMLGRQPPERLGVDAVAFLDPVRDVIVDVLGARQPEAGPEDARAADAVDVVIAVDDDLPARPGSRATIRSAASTAPGEQLRDRAGCSAGPRGTSTARAASSIPRFRRIWATSGETPRLAGSGPRSAPGRTA